jgi:hypothetical protein
MNPGLKDIVTVLLENPENSKVVLTVFQEEYRTSNVMISNKLTGGSRRMRRSTLAVPGYLGCHPKQ